MSDTRWSETTFAERVRAVCAEAVPLPGGGRTAQRHRRLIDLGREDLSLAKIVEAHWDAVAILAEAGHDPVPGAVYGVWASEFAGGGLELAADAAREWRMRGTKRFASGAGLIDRALVTTGGEAPLLLEVDLRANAGHVTVDLSVWQTEAFRLTRTGAVTFADCPVARDAQVGGPEWYVRRPGFWHGACGPAACWAGGLIGLVEVARRSTRRDPHTLAHLGALEAEAWGVRAVLEAAGREIDGEPLEMPKAQARALTVRHLVERAATEVLTRFARAYGPAPLAMQAEVARRWAELNLFVRQSHGERDLEALGGAVTGSLAQE